MVRTLRGNVPSTPHVLRQTLPGFLGPVRGWPGTSFSLCSAARVVKGSPDSKGGESDTNFGLRNGMPLQKGRNWWCHWWLSSIVYPLATIHIPPTCKMAFILSRRTQSFLRLVFQQGQIPGSCHLIRYRHNSLDTTLSMISVKSEDLELKRQVYLSSANPRYYGDTGMGWLQITLLCKAGAGWHTVVPGLNLKSSESTCHLLL